MTPVPSSRNIPAAPEYLPSAAAGQWKSAYAKALKQAEIDLPENEPGQRAAALKAANALIAVTAPTSAEEIDKLEPWQVILRELRTVKGVLTKLCVTIDGRKYGFPAPKPKASPNQTNDDSKPKANDDDAK